MSLFRSTLVASCCLFITLACTTQPVGSRYVKSETVTAASGRTISVSEKESSLLAGSSLEVPAGALVNDTHITLELGLESLLDAEFAAGPVLTWGPAGTKFSTPARMTIPVTGLQAGDEVSIFVREADGTQFELPANAVTVENGKATFAVTGFTSFQPQRRRPCQTNAECAQGETCRAGRCRPPANSCRADADCPASHRCVAQPCMGVNCPGSCQPVTVACMANSNCPSGQVCVGGTCQHPTACPQDALQCPDGSFVGRTGPNCTFPACPVNDGGMSCPQDVQQCADGTFVSRTGPNCTFPACPTDGGVVTDGGVRHCQGFVPPCSNSMQCGANAECVGDPMQCNPTACSCDPMTGAVLCTADCGGSVCRPRADAGVVIDGGIACPADAFQCPDGSFVSRTGPNCTFPACPTVRDAGVPTCQGFVPPCTNSMQCAPTESCVQVPGVCNPTSCYCNPATGAVTCTADCSGSVCRPTMSTTDAGVFGPRCQTSQDCAPSQTCVNNLCR